MTGNNMLNKEQQLALQGNNVAVLIPCYNEDITIEKVVKDFSISLPLADIYVYDNNSTDNTFEYAKSAGAIVKKHSIQGKGSVVRQMLRDIDADYYILVDGDDTYPAEEAYNLLFPLIIGNADMVVGDRLSNGSYENENKRQFHGFGNDLVRFLIKLMYNYEYDDVMTGYRAFSNKFAKCLPIVTNGFELETEMSIHAVDKGWRIEQVPVEYRDRPEGSVSKLSTVSDGIKVIRTILGLFKDYRPLALFLILFILCMIAASALFIPVFIDFRTTGLVAKMPSLIAAVGFGGAGLLMLVSGLILDTNVKSARKEYELSVLRLDKESLNHE